MAVPTRIDVMAVSGANTIVQVTGGGIDYIIETPNGTNYLFYVDINNDPAFVKSLDGGMTWGSPTVLKNTSCTAISVWYDRWSGINADLIHVIYADSGNDDVYYRSVDAGNGDSLGTEYTVFAGVSTAAGGALSISRMRGGNLIVVGCIDAGVEMFSKKSTDVGINWADIAAGYEANADLCIVMPGWGADNQDAMMFYYDRDATEISVKYYDDSANSWSETSIATSIAIPTQATTTLGHISAAVDLVNSQNLLAFWTAVDTANADLRCFKVTQSAQTETTSNVVLNSTDDQGFAGISIKGNIWYCFYAGSSNGIEVYPYYLRLYYKSSMDGGTTWGSETLITPSWRGLVWLATKPVSYKTIGVVQFYSIGISGLNEYTYNAPLSIARASYQLGM